MTTPPARRDLATSDCEHCRDGWVTQPANTVSSLAYVIAGAALLRAAPAERGRERLAAQALAWSVVATGVGSVAYHGPGGRLGHWAHDAAVIAMLGLVAANGVSERAGAALPTPVTVGVPLGAAALAHPRVSGAAQAAVGLAVVAVEAERAARSPDDHSVAELGSWAAALAGHLLGRTGSPCCRPDSLLQPHAAWHLLSAAALWLRVRRA